MSQKIEYKRTFYPQFGEDKVLFEIFRKKASGVYVEVGAGNGVEDSNSFFLKK